MTKLFTYTSVDKQIFRGNTAEEVVTEMRAQSFDGQKLPLDGFMRRSAATAYLWAKRPIRTDTPEQFLADLVDVGLMTYEGPTRQPAAGAQDDEQV